MKDHNYYVYMLTNWDGKVLYTGVTNDLNRRLSEHRDRTADSFTRKYNINKLVYYEHYHDIIQAKQREKQIKGWRREKKNNLVVSTNPEWQDLSENF